MKNFRFYLLIAGILFAPIAFAANITSPQQYSQFINVDIDHNGTDDFINWAPTGYGATVTDTQITGKIWGESVGWINLNPTTYYVTNTCDGELGGWAWGKNTGWINFHATGASPAPNINTTTGKITGQVWAQNYGWIELSSPETPPTTSYVPATGLVTTWHGCTGDDESAPGGGHVPPSVTQCSDNFDNDGDGLADPLDPGCHSDGNANNMASYVPLDTNEFNGTPGTPMPPSGPTNPPAIPNNPGNPQPNPTTPSLPNIFNPDTSLPNQPSTTGIVPGLLSGLANMNEPFGWILPILGLLGLMSTLPGLGVRFGNLFLTFIFARKKQRGVVFDAKTKQPLDPAYVTVFDASGKEFGNQITDMEGRYGFVLPPGTYRITVGKTNYQFPSHYLAGKTRDEVYNNLYFGAPFTIENSDQVTTMNIPMDPQGTDWNQEEKKRMSVWRFLGDYHKTWVVIFEFLFVIGFAGSVIITYLYPIWWNFLMVALYIILAIAYEYGWGQVSAGQITRGGVPVQNAIIRAFSANLNREVAHKVTTSQGSYYMLVPKGSYYITIEERQSDGTYRKTFTSNVMRASHGLINQAFKI